MRSKLALAAWLVGWCVGTASAAPCAVGTLGDYASLGAVGCTTDALTLADFTIEPFPGATVDVDPGGVTLAPSADGFALTLDSALAAGAGELHGLRFLFRVAGPLPLAGGSIALGPRTLAEDGAITAILDAAGAGTAIAFDIGLVADPAASFSSVPAAFFDVFVEIGVDGGVNGAAALGPGLVTVRFTPVPLPGAFGVWSMSLLLGLLAARRGRRVSSCHAMD